VTFTQDQPGNTFIRSKEDKEYPEERIVGWYHSQSGIRRISIGSRYVSFTRIFLVAACRWRGLYDPHSDEEGCFGLVGRTAGPPRF